MNTITYTFNDITDLYEFYLSLHGIFGQPYSRETVLDRYIAAGLRCSTPYTIEELYDFIVSVTK